MFGALTDLLPLNSSLKSCVAHVEGTTLAAENFPADRFVFS